MSATLALAKALIARESVTPHDNGCQAMLAERLGALGFNCESMPCGEVSNLWAEIGSHGPLLVFAGHTDVVPSGDPGQWQSPPFTPSERNNCLYGRGAADMKSSLAAMVTAAERLCADGPPPGRLAFLLTSDEEGAAVDGTVKVVQKLLERGVQIDYCLVGEPSSSARLGDTVKIGRRGSLSGKLCFQGSRGHVAYPHLADNSVHGGLPVLTELIALDWDQGNEQFPPTSLQISNVRAGDGASNVIPGSFEVDFNLRYSTEITAGEIKQRVTELLDRHNYDYKIDWRWSGEPFLTQPAELIEATRAAIREIAGIETELSTAGGTSDGRFIAPTGAQVVELGPVNASIHKTDEFVCIADLEPLSQMYERIAQRLFQG